MRKPTARKPFPRYTLLEQLVKAGDKGLTVYEASIAGPKRLKTVSTSSASKILEDFRTKGLVTRKIEKFRGRQPYYMTSLGRSVFEVAEKVSESERNGKPITIGKLEETFGEETVNKTVLACLIRYNIPSYKMWEAICSITKAGFLQAVMSPPVKKYAVVTYAHAKNR